MTQNEPTLAPAESVATTTLYWEPSQGHPNGRVLTVAGVELAKAFVAGGLPVTAKIRVGDFDAHTCHRESLEAKGWKDAISELVADLIRVAGTGRQEERFADSNVQLLADLIIGLWDRAGRR